MAGLGSRPGVLLLLAPEMPIPRDDLLKLPWPERVAMLPVGSRWRDQDGFELVVDAPVIETDRLEVNVTTWRPTANKAKPGRKDCTTANYILAVYDRIEQHDRGVKQ